MKSTICTLVIERLTGADLEQFCIDSFELARTVRHEVAMGFGSIRVYIDLDSDTVDSLYENCQFRLKED